MKIINLYFFIVLQITITSCSKQPECNDPESKNTVNELAKELLTTDLAFNEFIEKERWKLQLDQRNEKYFKDTKETIQNQISNQIYSTVRDSTFYTKYIDYAFDLYENVTPTLTNIRTKSISKELKNCSCEAELKFNNGNQTNLYYEVQINEEGETFVEISLLEN